MGQFWNEYPIVGFEWFLLVILSSIVSMPIIYIFIKEKNDFWKYYGGFIFLIYGLGYFIILVLFIGIGSNILKLFSIVPDEYFNFDKHTDFWDKYFYISYTIWYLISLIFICFWGQGEKESII